jgi:hypothetical protein
MGGPRQWVDGNAPSRIRCAKLPGLVFNKADAGRLTELPGQLGVTSRATGLWIWQRDDRPGLEKHTRVSKHIKGYNVLTQCYGLGVSSGLRG